MRLLALAFLASTLTTSAQTTTTLVTPPPPLLAPTMNGVARQGEATTGEDPAAFDPSKAAALREDGLKRWAKANYAGANISALQFADVSGARAALSMLTPAGATSPTIVQSSMSVPGSQIIRRSQGSLLLAGSTVLLIEGVMPAAQANALATALPKPSGNAAQPPLLPTLLPAKALTPGTARYALGPAGYAIAGGTLDPATLGWEKNAEATFARYKDKRGEETLTLLLYPTPQIAGEHTRALQAALPTAKIRREGELVAIAQGTFAPDAAQNLVENIHLRSEVTFDKNIAPSFQTEVRKTYSLLTSIAVLFGVLAIAAVLLGLFLGGGRAAIRKLRGKDAATEAEFLSLHLQPQNPTPHFEPTPPRTPFE